ncbi:hypothetical protein CRUP_027577 [Coryphaenoides rupestris]|nr:hypothetical protein CRUP_027577 [Coryphaenoides rupestris]
MDPDNFSIPYLTALGDLLGTGFLALCFHVLWLIGDRDADFNRDQKKELELVFSMEDKLNIKGNADLIAEFSFRRADSMPARCRTS